MAGIDIALLREIDVNADPEAVYSLLADTRASLAHYPALDALIELGDDCWRWEMTPTGVKGVSHQVIYSVRYDFDPQAKIIKWTPLQADSDNADIQGKFVITAGKTGSHIVLDTDGCIELPFPKLIAMAARPVVKREFAQQIDAFLGNIKKALE